jgi:Clathrin light chain
MCRSILSLLLSTHAYANSQTMPCVVYTLQALEAARADHEKFVSERQTRRDTRMSSNRTQEQVFLEQLEADLESDNPWERIVSLVDTQVCTRCFSNQVLIIAFLLLPILCTPQFRSYHVLCFNSNIADMHAFLIHALLY